MSKYKVEQICQLSDIEKIKKEWNLLAGLDKPLFPFLSCEWFLNWFSSFDETSNQLVYVVKEGNEIKAIAPMTARISKKFGISVRMLSFAGNDHTHAIKVISEPTNRNEYIEEILKKIVEEGHSHLFFRNINIDEDGVKHIINCLEQNRLPFFWGTRFVRQSQVANISNGWEEYKKGISKRFRKNLNNHRNRLEKSGILRIKKYVTTEDIESKAILAIAKISENSWQGKSGSGIFSVHETEQFYKNMVKDFAPKNWLAIWILYYEGSPAAYEFHIVADKHIYALKSEFDSRLKAFSVGNVLAAHILEKLAKEGNEIYNMSGYFEEYKQSWPGFVEKYIRIFAYRKNLVGLILYLLDFPVRNMIRWIVKKFRK